MKLLKQNTKSLDIAISVTEEKDFFGYSLKEINGNENGTYIDDTIYVEYIYTNTMGTGDIEELPPQTGVEQSNLYN